MNQNDIRQSLRKKIRAQRNALTADEQLIASKSLITLLESLPQLQNATNIAIYLSNDSELDTSLFIQWCWNKGIKTYLPVIHPFCKGHLLFIHYHQDSKMFTNKYGILEPVLNVQNVLPLNQLDLIFTPLVAFDKTGARLGMGGGYYDRTLSPSKHTASNYKPYAIGLAHDCQLVDAIPTEDWDIPIPEIITPTKHFKFI